MKPNPKLSSGKAISKGNQDKKTWATKQEQRNNTSANLFITYKGERDTVANIARKHNTDGHIITRRLGHGWTIEKAFATPVKTRESFKFKLEQAMKGKLAKVREEAYQQGFKDGSQDQEKRIIGRLNEVPRIEITHKDGTKSIAILEHSLKTHSLLRKENKE